MTVAVPEPGVYEIVPARSFVTFTTKHLFGLGTVRGQFELRSGTVTITDPPAGSSAVAVVAADSFATGNSQRDAKVASAALLDVAKHPDITFTSTAAAQDAEGGWTLQGTITARGTSAPVGVHVRTSTLEANTLTLTATATVDRFAHGITGMRGLAGRHLQLAFDVHAVRA